MFINSRNPYVFQVNSKIVFQKEVLLWELWMSRNPYVFQVNSKFSFTDGVKSSVWTSVVIPMCFRSIQNKPQRRFYHDRRYRRNPYVFQVNSKDQKEVNMSQFINTGSWSLCVSGQFKKPKQGDENLYYPERES